MLGMCAMSAEAGQDFFELPPINYSETASEDAVAKLTRELEKGDWVIPPGDSKAFLEAVLDKLNVPVESQVLVFSKTSFQIDIINQGNPRALYFSPDVYVGWVPGGKVEIIIEDEVLGPVFYTVEAPVGGGGPRFVRANDACLTCHATSRTEGVPGMFIRSVVPDKNAHPILSAGTSLVTDATPLEERWGGWFVTGASDDPHLGNRWVPESRMDDVDFPAMKGEPLKDVSSLINTSKYLTPRSDIVALMVLEHQCQMHNLITKGKYGYRRSVFFQLSIDPEADLDDPEGMSWKTADQAAKEIVGGLTFADEVQLGGDGVEGGEEFAKVLRTFAPETKEGKSLVDLRLYSRLFRYRCSYMIYSKAFRSLPPLVKERVFVHLREHLEAEGGREERTILKILGETLPGFSEG